MDKSKFINCNNDVHCKNINQCNSCYDKINKCVYNRYPIGIVGPTGATGPTGPAGGPTGSTGPQ